MKSCRFRYATGSWLLYDAKRLRTLREIYSDSALIQIRSPGTAAFLTVPLLACAAILPWLTPAPASHWWLYPLGLTGLILAAYAACRPRTAHIPLDQRASLLLESVDSPDDPLYRVVLVQGGQRTRLIDHPSAELVARDLGRVLEATGLPLEESTAAPAEYFRRDGDVRAGTLEALEIVSKSSPAQVRTERAVWGAAGFAFLVFGWSLLHAKSSVSWLSLVLPPVGIAAVLLIGARVSSARTSIDVSKAGVRVEQTALFGRPQLLFNVAAADLCGACALKANDSSAVHTVVVTTTKGPRVVTLDVEGAKRLVNAIGPILKPRVPESDTATSGVLGPRVTHEEAGAVSEREAARC